MYSLKKNRIMKENRNSQQGQSNRTGGRQNQNKKGSNESQGARKNADVSAADRGEEPVPPTPAPDMPPNPSRREYEDPEPGHEHTYHPPKAPGFYQVGFIG